MQARTSIPAAAALFLLLASATATASAEVVVVVSAKSAVTSLSKDQVSQLFLNKAVSFPGGGAATPVDQAEGPARDEFYSKVTGKAPAQLKAYWAQLTFSGKAQRPKQVGTGADAKKFVAGSPSAIGYLNAADVDGSVRVVFKP